ncbi:MAG: DUF2007 domain-containing protein [Actinomycetota bacterium]|nr:DUF2007 domain-containing protein [Actinomycetota bacterium]
MPTRLDAPPPVIDGLTDDGGGSEWVHLIKARHDIDAHLLEGRLRAAGVEARKIKDRGDPGAWLYGGSNPWAPVNILVRKMQLEDARIVLAEISIAGPSVDELRRAAPYKPPTIAWWAIAIALGLGLTGVALARTSEATGRCELPLLCGESAPATP